MTKLPSKARVRRDLVLGVLAHGPATRAEIAEATGLEERDVRYALRILAGGNVVSVKTMPGGPVYELWESVIARLKSRERGRPCRVHQRRDETGRVVA